MASIAPTEAGSLEAIVMLDTIAWSEGTSVDGGNPITLTDGYDIIVQGVGDRRGGEIFLNYSQHPFANGRPAKLIVEPGPRFPNGLRSTASGRYQFILSTCKALQAKLGLTDFSPMSQDLMALELMRQRGALAALDSGEIAAAIAAHYTPTDLDTAIEDEANIWASLPGNAYGQGGHSLTEVVAEYEKLLAGATA